MALDLRQSLRLTQQLLMTPQLQQAIKLLQLSRLELEQFVETQLQENPVLEEGAIESSEELAQVERETEQTEAQAMQDHISEASSIVDHMPGDDKKEIDWEEYSKFQESLPPSYTSGINRDAEAPNYENIITKSKTLQEHLTQQIGELDFSSDELKISTMLIGNIDDKGYLNNTTVEEVATNENVTVDFVEGILDTIQRLDPPGIGARDLKECLLIQLRNGRFKNGIVEKIVEFHLHDLENRNYQAISKALKIPLNKVIENVQIISELEPVPGRPFGGDVVPYVVPDVYVFKLGDEWVVHLNEEGLPELKVSNFYSNLLNKTEAKGADKNYIQEKLKSAVWLIKSIQQRQRTIFKVAECIVKRQHDFFEKGVEHLRPMILKDIAEDISMHESTISRVTNNKYMHTPRGIVELKYFFNSSVARADGDDLASESVKKMIEELIKNEDLKHPFSDQKIVEMLEEKGIHLARRTVAKYREQLRILPSAKRKKYF